MFCFTMNPFTVEHCGDMGVCVGGWGVGGGVCVEGSRFERRSYNSGQMVRRLGCRSLSLNLSSITSIRFQTKLKTFLFSQYFDSNKL